MRKLSLVVNEIVQLHGGCQFHSWIRPSVQYHNLEIVLRQKLHCWSSISLTPLFRSFSRSLRPLSLYIYISPRSLSFSFSQLNLRFFFSLYTTLVLVVWLGGSDKYLSMSRSVCPFTSQSPRIFLSTLLALILVGLNYLSSSHLIFLTMQITFCKLGFLCIANYRPWLSC